MSNQNNVFKALSDPTRRRILQLLREKDLSAGEISDSFNISKPSISHHLNLLKQADLVIDERHGQNIYYSLNTTVFQELMSFFLNLVDKEEEKTNESDRQEGGKDL